MNKKLYPTLIMGTDGQWTCTKCQAQVSIQSFIELHKNDCPFKGGFLEEGRGAGTPSWISLDAPK